VPGVKSRYNIAEANITAERLILLNWSDQNLFRLIFSVGKHQVKLQFLRYPEGIAVSLEFFMKFHLVTAKQEISVSEIHGPGSFRLSGVIGIGL